MRTCRTISLAILALVIALMAVFVTASEAQSDDTGFRLCWIGGHNTVVAVWDQTILVGFTDIGYDVVRFLNKEEVRHAQFVLDAGGCANFEEIPPRWTWSAMFGLFAFRQTESNKYPKLRKAHVHRRGSCNFPVKQDWIRNIVIGGVLILIIYVLAIALDQPVLVYTSALVR